MSESDKPSVGDVVTYVDEHSQPHDALVTIYFGGDSPNGAMNLVFVSSDPDKSDPYGRQIERRSSISRQSEYTAPGNYWIPKA